ncbi:MAG: class I SAM-dependent methyltransferase [Burkholderiales bacterium]|nr:class I SAM-dependent methyltransferase [Burkholderiales bacterium]
MNLIPTNLSCLEIGPFNKPLLAGSNVKYFDVLDQNGLIKRAGELNIESELIPQIDFVSEHGDLKVVDEKFAVVLSSHVVEHQPNLIAHLQAVADILLDSGRYFLIIPDRRFSFDYFLAESSLAKVVAANVESRKTHTLTSVIEHRCLTTHNNPYLHLLGIHGKPMIGQELAQVVKLAITECQNNLNGYIDVHAWYFTPSGFCTLINRLFELGLIKFKVEKVYPTTPGKLEFFVILRKVS